MKISSILNPTPSSPSTMRRTNVSTSTRRTSPHTATSSSSPSPAYSPSPKVTFKAPATKKNPKDAPKWEEGPTAGEVKYPPFVISSDYRKKLEAKFDFFAGPSGDMAMYPEHIPYSSEKKNFLAKTGREGFDGQSLFLPPFCHCDPFNSLVWRSSVFHYTFRYKAGSDEEKDWVVMWDYNIGLVRITPFFKCMHGHRKVCYFRHLSFDLFGANANSADGPQKCNLGESGSHGSLPQYHRWCYTCTRFVDISYLVPILTLIIHLPQMLYH